MNEPSSRAPRDSRFPAPRTFIVAIAAIVVVAGLVALLAPTPTTTVILVRHAEKLTEPADDPPLSPAGTERARLLAGMLADSGVDAIYSSEARRARETVEPLAAALDLPLRVHPAADVEGLARSILVEHRGRIVVVAGHSNTVPAIVAALGAPDPGPIDDATYDLLFVVTVPRRGPATVLRLRYGAS